MASSCPMGTKCFYKPIAEKLIGKKMSHVTSSNRNDIVREFSSSFHHGCYLKSTRMNKTSIFVREYKYA
jgi:hypothetical protein